MYHERILDNGDRLIVSYSSKRAAKDALNRAKGVERLKKAFASGKVTKDKINRRGYGKFLKIDNDVRVSLCQDKIDEDEKGTIKISDARAAELGSSVKVKGIVTFKEASGNGYNYAIQDKSAGIITVSQ